MNKLKILEEYSELIGFSKQFKDNYMDLYKEITNTASKVEYAVKGTTIHRGFYCPSPTVDIVVGNISRGKLLKKVTSKSLPTYKYYFDEDNRLCAVDSFTECGTNIELIFYDGGVETGI